MAGTAAYRSAGEREIIGDGVQFLNYRELGERIGKTITALRDPGLERRRDRPADDHVHIVSDSQASVLIVDPTRYADRAQAIRERFASLDAVVAMGPCDVFENLRARIDSAQPAPLVGARGALVMDGYWRQPAMTEQVFAGGWLHTGNVGIRHADGYITIVDQTKAMIVFGGVNIYPREVEDTLMSHFAVTLAA